MDDILNTSTVMKIFVLLFKFSPGFAHMGPVDNNTAFCQVIIARCRYVIRW